MLFFSVFFFFFRDLGPVSRKSRKLFGPEKPFLKLRHPYSVKLVFSYIVKGIKINITAKFRASRRLRFEDTTSIMAPEMRPKSFGTFEKQAPDPMIMIRSRFCRDWTKLTVVNLILMKMTFLQIFIC